MKFEELMRLLQARSNRPLLAVRESILQGAWNGKSYRDIARESGYSEAYIRGEAAALWVWISEELNVSVTKTRLRSVLAERSLLPDEQLQIARHWQGRLDRPPFPDGPLPLGSPFYFSLLPDEEAIGDELAQPGGVVRLRSPEGAGKTTALLRLGDRLRARGDRLVSLSLRQVERAILDDWSRLLRWLAAAASQQLSLPVAFDRHWDDDISSSLSCTTYFQNYLLPQVGGPTVLAIDDLDRLFDNAEASKDFLMLLRSWIEMAKSEPGFGHLRFAIAHATEAYGSLDISQSPFNLGLTVRLRGLAPVEVQCLALLYGLDWTEEPARILGEDVGGHPQRVQLALYHLATEGGTLEGLLAEAGRSGGIYRNSLQAGLTLLKGRSDLAELFGQVLRGQAPATIDPLLEYALASVGLIVSGDRPLRPSCPLYTRYFLAQGL